MGLFSKIKDGLKRTQSKLFHEIKRIVTASPKLTGDSLEELEYVLISADLGMQMTQQIIDAAKNEFETQGKSGDAFFEIARNEIEKSLTAEQPELVKSANGLTIVSMVGVNGTGKTTTSAKLAHMIQGNGQTCMLAACDTFRAAAIDQLKLWGERLSVEVVASDYGSDPASVAHDAVTSAKAKNCDYLFIDTAGRLHTKNNLMKELEKLHRVIGKQEEGAPHEVLLVVDATTGSNALNQAREFNKIAPLTGLVVTKLDGTSKGGMVVAIQKELGLPVKFIGVGEQAGDLQPFDPAQYARALFPEDAAEVVEE